MAKTETLEDFYRQKLNWLPENLQKDIGHFNVFRLEDCMGTDKAPVKYSRREFYKVTLMRGRHAYHYADKSVEVSGTTLLFFNPNVPYTFEQLSGDSTGFFCIFKEAFFTSHLRNNIRELPMFSPQGRPGYQLSKQQDKLVSGIFEKMLTEIASDYVYKYDLIRNYVTEMIHHAMKMQPTETLYQHVDANARITAVFTELLERQFPIESPTQRFSLRSARDFAEQLAVHVNHLNRAIRHTTGKTTTDHIFERLASEAMALLKHTNWNISEISYSLGFEEPAHFNHFFRKQTSQTPTAYRANALA
ncbi:AraC family transcriptional regulator [Chitinophaga sp. XS-30]|uniref:helix-turn-helix domain-containing protein n=1 Tax=Chitinophaga sp. XS-30 TaxID=2604421 RepID=UPI0011DD5F24|nr:response regulator transcription factor [Chitinophaga sp. XS-30]QEH43177.1 helix-turn-helix transcriptional regulator [Chitinophaga sp. XS-30]